MATINPYLMFNGNCEEAFNFYKSVFGTDFCSVSRFKEMPSSPDYPPLPAEYENLIMHISLRTDKKGEGPHLMGGDYCEAMGAPAFVAGNNFSISINVNSEEEANKLFGGISAGGQVTMPLSKQFWGGYWGMCNDKFGIAWQVSFFEKQQ